MKVEHVDAAVLADYWLALLAGPDEDAVEQHLLACDPCGDRLREIMALADSVRQLARRGSLRMVVPDAFVKRAAGDGLRVREYAPPQGGSVECTVTAEDDVVVGRLAASLAGVSRVDLSLCNEAGVEQVRLPDIPFDARTGNVIYQESVTALKAAPTNRMIARLIAVSDSGREELLGEYTFNHTRSLPGPGAW
jgi:hypothetical protein